jgi:methylenetetrahydrofolate reductase (NADPH)
MNTSAIDLLRGYSAEVTANDRKSIEFGTSTMAPGTEVFITSLPSDTDDRLVLAAIQLSNAGLHPVPHIVARNIPSLAALDRLLGRLTSQARVDRVLLLAGDRNKPAGELHSSLQMLESGLLERRGIRKIAITAYPEGHPRVAASEIAAARIAKMAVARRCGMQVTFVTQFCFDSAPIIALARQIRSDGIAAPIRVGIAGAASGATLLKYSLICGVGPSLRALKKRPSAARNLLAGETPEALLRDLSAAQDADPSLGMTGVHFFTFGSLAATVDWVENQKKVPVLT